MLELIDCRVSSESTMRRGFVRRSSRLLLVTVLTGIALIVLGALFYRQELTRLSAVIRLFDADRIVQNFRSMDTLFAVTPVSHGGATHRFASAPHGLPSTYEYDGMTKEVGAFLDKTWTTGLIVLRDGRIAHEQYYRGNTSATKAIGWSTSKSVVSMLVGIAVEEGLIRDLDDAVSDYVPSLRGGAYDGISIKDVLQMASGVRFSEDYGDFFSDINRLARAIALNTSLEDFIASLQHERSPGKVHHYMSMDTQVLGMVVRAATGQTLAAYLQSRIWRRVGMESDAYWLVDRSGVELAFGGLNAALRDFARLGQLYLNEGRWEGEQIVPQAWVSASVKASALGIPPTSSSSQWAQGYGYQWWIPRASAGDYLAVGHSLQSVYVYPAKKIVIAKTSAYPGYDVDGDEKERETIAVFRAIVQHLSATK